MSHAEKRTRVVVCIRCKRRHRNRSGTDVCGRCEDNTQDTSSVHGIGNPAPPGRAYVRIRATAQGVCCCCGKQTRIDPRDGYCIEGHKKRLQDGRLDALKQKIR